MSEFIEYLRELLSEFGPTETRRMFGGHGIFHEGLMIGLVANEQFYLKADETSRRKFTDAGLAQFTYRKADREIAMSYFQAPPDALDDPAVMAGWAQLAYEAALRAKKKKE